MSLISCPNCNSQISDRAKMCPNCGFLLQDYLVKKAEEERIQQEEEQRKLEEELRKQEEERRRREEEEKSKVPCPECGIRILPTEKVCPECGYPIAKKKAEAEESVKQAEAQRQRKAEEQNRKQQEEEKRLIEAERISLESEKELLASLRLEMQQKEAELQKLSEKVNTEKSEFVLAKESFEKEMNERQSSVLQEEKNVAEAKAALQLAKEDLYARLEINKKFIEEAESEEERLGEENKKLIGKIEQLENEKDALQEVCVAANAKQNDLHKKIDNDKNKNLKKGFPRENSNLKRIILLTLSIFALCGIAVIITFLVKKIVVNKNNFSSTADVEEITELAVSVDGENDETEKAEESTKAKEKQVLSINKNVEDTDNSVDYTIIDFSRIYSEDEISKLCKANCNLSDGNLSIHLRNEKISALKQILEKKYSKDSSVNFCTAWITLSELNYLLDPEIINICNEYKMNLFVVVNNSKSGFYEWMFSSGTSVEQYFNPYIEFSTDSTKNIPFVVGKTHIDTEFDRRIKQLQIERMYLNDSLVTPLEYFTSDVDSVTMYRGTPNDFMNGIKSDEYGVYDKGSRVRFQRPKPSSSFVMFSE